MNNFIVFHWRMMCLFVILEDVIKFWQFSWPKHKNCLDNKCDCCSYHPKWITRHFLLALVWVPEYK